MYLAMNRFKIHKDRAEDFIRMWKERESYLDEMEGFVAFHLLRGAEEDGAVLFASYTHWREKKDFENWVGSEQFKKSHARAHQSDRTMFAGPSKLELFESVI